MASPDLTMYKSVQRWHRQLRKRATKIDPNAEIPPDTLRLASAALGKYTEYIQMNPDQIIEDCRHENREVGDLTKHMDLLDSFWESCKSKTTAGIYTAYLKGFYASNGLTIKYKTGGIPKIRDKDILIATEQVRAICDVANLKHKAWIIANNYMGLRIGAFPSLKVENFNVENWKEDKCIYPVFIPRSISGTFDYYTFIGNDAMQILKLYFRKKKLGKNDYPWKSKGSNSMAGSGMNDMLKLYAHRAGVIDAPNGLHPNGVPKGFCKIHSHIFRKRVQTTLEKHDIAANWVAIMLGHVPKVGQGQAYSIPPVEDLQAKYLKALASLEVYGHHKDTPTTVNVELQKLRMMEQVRTIASNQGWDMAKIETLMNPLKSIRTKNEIEEALQNIMVMVKKK